LITGGDSGIGRAVAVHYAREGADVAIVHLSSEEVDANDTKKLVEAEGGKCIAIKVRDKGGCSCLLKHWPADRTGMVSVGWQSVQMWHSTLVVLFQR
jgi:NAD(P)-dependent dehydrogenase (short-subunit alcohol dehydrogenase family)